MVDVLIADRKGPWLCIDYLWVSESARSGGLGGKLVRMAEKEGVLKGCIHGSEVSRLSVAIQFSTQTLESSYR